jgi:hypothetical protein
MANMDNWEEIIVGFAQVKIEGQEPFPLDGFAPRL